MNGDNVRVGTEDYPFNQQGKVCTTHELVKEIADISRSLGRSVGDRGSHLFFGQRRGVFCHGHRSVGGLWMGCQIVDDEGRNTDGETSKAEAEIDYMLGGKGINSAKARDLNFRQANAKLAETLNNSPELAKAFGMKAGNIKASHIEKYRVKNDLTWHELNGTKTMQLVPKEINSSFGHLGGVGEINAGAFENVI